LRIGLLSATLKTHPVGWLTIAAFEGLDHNRFELVCFGQTPSADAMQRRFAALAAEWHEVTGLPPARVAERIRAAEIDVLIDLGGFGDLGMMAACALRPTPVQVKWVGAQSHSSGLAEMDWYITDRWETPEGSEPFYSERLWRMPDGYVCYSPAAYAPDVAPLPALARKHVTFGCFNNLAKVTPRVLDAWAAILRDVPDARLVLKCHQCDDAGTVAALLAAFDARGVVPARIEARGGSRHRDLLAQYGDIDIVLDPFPYTGGLTTCEALWMGVPTVCLTGETFSGRHSTSHMSNVGLAAWCAGSIADYVRLAVDRAGDIPALASLRAGLRQRTAASPLCDGRRFGRNLGDALGAMWEARPRSTSR
jgi:predicted O-linked N-acetylglucosamine transferase (SPINDLY family)